MDSNYRTSGVLRSTEITYRPDKLRDMPKTWDSAESFWFCEGLDDDSAHRAIRCSYMAVMAESTRQFELDILSENKLFKLERD
ncbi:uncharacterized protein N7483_005014 [Penicillium malachiteum]|uniref:uncharacterized protein n=1 Tax=Penicillium malachiteum TaxID=1324776 RepID=UPI002548C61F|nr:uncharacterized protein N7483_005014 [Penicillium malachiteum]KAJ5730506.1 hypothetical protein N7483_005014 [Penicillium malachiteum]